MRHFLSFLLASSIVAPSLYSPMANAASAAPQDRSHGEVVHLYWKKEEIYDRNRQTVTLTGGARAQRGDITVDADVLIGYLRHKANTKAHETQSAPDDEAETSNSNSSSLELYRVEARGHVHIYNRQDQGWGDHGLYDVDKAVMVMTGANMKFTTPHQLLTAKDLVEYYPNTHVTIGRGNASVTTTDGHRVVGDVLESVGLSDRQKSQNASHGAPNGEHSNLDRAYGWGHVVIRTRTQTATGDRGVYLFGPQLARLIGHVRVTQGENQNNGSQAIVDMKTGISHMLPGTESPIQGLIVPNEANQ
ncbi:LptA/OstA family protein [Saccharibacter sp. 17.LH.SD]|uniref:LptA/OstA family protein n=1 Tax=Saccharibacter sp. 17.LH.SD TaxID=2689393 RepID=UPI00351B9BFE